MLDPRIAQPQHEVITRGLKSRRLARALTAPKFIHEIHHLLHRPPAIFMPGADGGIQCREHAVLVAVLAGLMGYRSTICTGETSFIGPLLSGEQAHVHFLTHAWVDVAGFGLCDLSPDLAAGHGPGWCTWPGQVLVASRFHPADGVRIDYFVDHPLDWCRAIQTALNASETYAACYLEKNRQPFDNILYVGAVNFTLSPLMRELSTLPGFSLDILGKAATHLWDVINGHGRTLVGVPQMDAWRVIAARNAGAAERIRNRLNPIFSP